MEVIAIIIGITASLCLVFSYELVVEITDGFRKKFNMANLKKNVKPEPVFIAFGTTGLFQILFILLIILEHLIWLSAFFLIYETQNKRP